MKNNTLICTMGASPQVISETYSALFYKGILINKIVVIHTDDKRFVIPQIRNLKNEIEKQKVDISFSPVSVGCDDILTPDDNERLLNTLLNSISIEKKSGSKVYMSIAGGRKTMSALALVSGYICGVEGIYHILADESNKLTSEINFKIPEKFVRLIEIPRIELSALFNTMLRELTPEDTNIGIEDFLEKKTNITSAINDIHSGLEKILNINRYKIYYEKNFYKFNKMCEAVKTIISAYAVKEEIFYPEFQFRVKKLDSIMEKTIRKSAEKKKIITDPYDTFHDICGVRVITFFNNDVHKLVKAIKSSRDFQIKVQKRDKSAFLYRAIHIDLKLSEKRLKLVEYSDLEGIWCEVQLKTVFANAWAALDHRFVYKNAEHKLFSDEKKKKIKNIFVASGVHLKDTEREIQKLMKYYKNK